MTQQRRAFGHNGSIRDDTRELGRSLLRSGRARSRPTVASRGEAAAHGVGPPARACAPPFIEVGTRPCSRPTTSSCRGARAGRPSSRRQRLPGRGHDVFQRRGTRARRPSSRLDDRARIVRLSVVAARVRIAIASGRRPDSCVISASATPGAQSPTMTAVLSARCTAPSSEASHRMRPSSRPSWPRPSSIPQLAWKQAASSFGARTRQTHDWFAYTSRPRAKPRASPFRPLGTGSPDGQPPL